MNPTSLNPYASASAKDTGFEGAPKERASRQFRFNPKGKYVQLANQQRQEIQLEALKQRIAEGARKAGLDSEFETLEKNIRVCSLSNGSTHGADARLQRVPPPEAEWWDAELLPNKTYSDIDTLGIERLKINTNGSPITIYIQHPIPIPGPTEKSKTGLKPLMLTAKVPPNCPILLCKPHLTSLSRSARSCASKSVPPNCRINVTALQWASCHPMPPKVPFSP